MAMVPRSAWSTRFPDSTPSRLTVGFHGSAPAVAALAWTIGEAERRDGVVCAVMAWCEGGYAGLGGPVEIVAALPSVVGRSAHRLAADSLSTCGLREQQRHERAGRKGADHDEAMALTHRLGAYRFDRRLVRTPRLDARPGPGADTTQSGGQRLAALLHCCSVGDPAVVAVREI